ncbi:HAD family hydrolase [Micromonospora sp. NPDC050397]|uniref:HAD family hydrolase n=1 Tax=Micromonospora sp. NPDC050397 TaxID=3364279 RepID=UPI00385005B1
MVSGLGNGGFGAVVFDFDGLLMDTESTLVEGWRAEWAYHGLSLDLDGFWPDHGGNLTEHRLDQLAALVGPSFDRATSHARFSAHRRRMHVSMDFRPGIRDWLREARQMGLACAIASSSRSLWVSGHLARVGAVELFDVVATGDEVAAHKPDPGVYLLALDRLGVEAHRAVAVEDTPHGITAATVAGMVTVGIPNPYVDINRLDHADLALASAADLPLAEVLSRVSRRPGHDGEIFYTEFDVAT